MARTYSNVQTGIWHDDDFRRLSPLAQHLYLYLLTSPGLSYAGLADWRPNRISGMAEAWTPEAIEYAGAELAQAKFILVCERTEEALVRTFLRHDGLLKNAKLAVSAANAVASIASNDLRAVAIHEAGKAKKEHPEWSAWKHDAIKTMLKRNGISADDLDPFGPDLAPALGRLIGGGDDADLAVA